MFKFFWLWFLNGFTFLTLLKNCSGRKCPKVEDGKLNATKFIDCPSLNDSAYYTDCCLGQCCPKNILVNEIDDRMIMRVGITVICTCLVLVVAIIVCCFWSRCPLYNSCKGNYLQGDIIAESKEDDPLNSTMPPEEKAGQTHYSPNVSVRLGSDV